jgi:hypothetical protein
LENLGVDGRILLEWILGKQGGKKWNECMWLRIETVTNLQVPSKAYNFLTS